MTAGTFGSMPIHRQQLNWAACLQAGVQSVNWPMEYLQTEAWRARFLKFYGLSIEPIESVIWIE
jgi:hypothetical protein